MSSLWCGSYCLFEFFCFIFQWNFLRLVEYSTNLMVREISPVISGSGLIEVYFMTQHATPSMAERSTHSACKPVAPACTL